MFTKQHYQTIASLLYSQYDNFSSTNKNSKKHLTPKEQTVLHGEHMRTLDDFVDKLTAFLKGDDERFNERLFRDAVRGLVIIGRCGCDHPAMVDGTPTLYLGDEEALCTFIGCDCPNDRNYTGAKFINGGKNAGGNDFK